MKISNIDLIIQNIFKRNIKNCKDSLKDEITQYVLNSFNGKINKANVYAHIKEKYIFPAVGSNTKSYWRSRGYSEAEVQFIIHNKKKENTKTRKYTSPFSKEFWLNRINENTGLLYTDEEAEFKRNSIRPIRKEYWLLQGFSEDESIIKAQEAKSNNDKNTKGKKLYRLIMQDL